MLATHVPARSKLHACALVCRLAGTHSWQPDTRCMLARPQLGSHSPFSLFPCRHRKQQCNVPSLCMHSPPPLAADVARLVKPAQHAQGHSGLARSGGKGNQKSQWDTSPFGGGTQQRGQAPALGCMPAQQQRLFCTMASMLHLLRDTENGCACMYTHARTHCLPLTTPPSTSRHRRGALTPTRSPVSH